MLRSRNLIMAAAGLAALAGGMPGAAPQACASEDSGYWQPARPYDAKSELQPSTTGMSLFHTFKSTIGVELGANLSNITLGGLPNGVPLPSLSGQTHFIGGLTKDWPLFSIFSLQTELRYAVFGSTDSSTGFAENFDYLELPVLLKTGLELDGWFPFVLAGFVPGYRIGLSSNLKSSSFNTINYALGFGGGAEIPFSGKVSGFLQVEYELGLSNILVNSGAISETQKLTGIEIMAGLEL